MNVIGEPIDERGEFSKLLTTCLFVNYNDRVVLLIVEICGDK